MEFIEVAKIINVHGIKGTVKIYSLTSNIERFKADCKFYIDKKIAVTIKSVRELSSELALLTFNAVSYTHLGKSVQDLFKLCDKEIELKKMICGTLGELISVDEKYKKAIDTVLSSNLQGLSLIHI